MTTFFTLIGVGTVTVGLMRIIVRLDQAEDGRRSV